MSNYQVDAKRLLCPLPVIRLQQKIDTLVAGDTVEIYCTDPGALNDIPAWCNIHGHEVLEKSEKEGKIHLIVQVGNTSE